jgi:hypothetical protein
MNIKQTIVKLCGGSNSYISTKVGCKSSGELTSTIRTNIQEIANSNEKIELMGYMFGKWIIKNTSVFFSNGLFKALKEGLL